MAATTTAAAAVAATTATPTPPVTSAALYVGDLDKEVTESQLYELFSQVGPVTSIRVCRDAVTRRSLGYAYVNYNSIMDEKAAERAIEALNYQVVNGRPMRIMWSHRDPSTRRSGVGNIFIKNLDESIDNKALHDTFSAFGNILSCKIVMSDGKSKGYGFVHFETEEGANLAIEKVNGMLLEGKKVFVGKFLKKNERDPDSNVPQFTNVFVKNLDADVSEEKLTEHFSQVGDITNVAIMLDAEGKSRGFGFVNFREHVAASEAVEKLNGSTLGGKAIFVGRAQKKSEREEMLRKQFEEKKQERLQKYQGVNLYVKNLDESIDDDKLRAEFESFGSISSVKVMRDDKGTSRGFGFVCFSTPEEANKAITEANGRMISNKPVYVALAQRKEARKAQLEQQYAMRVAGIAPAGVMQLAPPGTPGGQPPMFPAGAPVFFAAPPGMMAGPGGAQQRQGGMIYQPMVPRGVWRGAPMHNVRPNFQPMPNYNSSIGPRQRNQRHRFNMQQGLAQSPAGAVPGVQPRGPRQNLKYAPNLPNGRGAGPIPATNPLAQQQQGPPNGLLPGGIPVGGVAPIPVVPMPIASAGTLPPQAAAAAAAAVPGGQIYQLPTDALNPTLLAAAPPAQQKQMLGERLFPLIQRHQPELAGKITGMLLEMDNSELLLLLESPEALLAKVEEALMVLRQHNEAAGEVIAGEGAAPSEVAA